jgi:uncharacterized protein Yka (UPF0111/DUF47 family)
MTMIPMAPLTPFPSVDYALELCARHARYVREGAAILHAELGRLAVLDAEVSRLTEVEREADQVIEQVITVLPHVVSRPSERLAFLRLTHALDDMLHDIDTALTRMLLFRLTISSPLAAALAEVLIQQAEALERTLAGMHPRRKQHAIQDHLTLARGLAAEADGLRMQSFTGLGSEALDQANVVTWLKWSEVHRPLSRATRHGRDAAEAIERLVVRLI